LHCGGTGADAGSRVSQHFCDSLAELQRCQTELAAQIGQIKHIVNVPAGARTVVTSAVVNEYLDLCLDRWQHPRPAGIEYTAKRREDDVGRSHRIGREINHIATAVSRSSNSSGAASSSDVPANRSPSETSLAIELTQACGDFAQVDARLQAEYLDPIGD